MEGCCRLLAKEVALALAWKVAFDFLEKKLHWLGRPAVDVRFLEKKLHWRGSLLSTSLLERSCIGVEGCRLLEEEVALAWKAVDFLKKTLAWRSWGHGSEVHSPRVQNGRPGLNPLSLILPSFNTAIKESLVRVVPVQIKAPGKLEPLLTPFEPQNDLAVLVSLFRQFEREGERGFVPFRRSSKGSAAEPVPVANP